MIADHYERYADGYREGLNDGNSTGFIAGIKTAIELCNQVSCSCKKLDCEIRSTAEEIKSKLLEMINSAL